MANCFFAVRQQEQWKAGVRRTASVQDMAVISEANQGGPPWGGTRWSITALSHRLQDERISKLGSRVNFKKLSSRKITRSRPTLQPGSLIQDTSIVRQLDINICTKKKMSNSSPLFWGLPKMFCCCCCEIWFKQPPLLLIICQIQTPARWLQYSTFYPSLHHKFHLYSTSNPSLHLKASNSNPPKAIRISKLTKGICKRLKFILCFSMFSQCNCIFQLVMLTRMC